MTPRYDSQLHEAKIAELWEQAAAFNPDTSSSARNSQPFCIILPPPNANDPLHIGHAMYTVEDVLIRFHRLLGDDTLWLPGTDHAGIETQFLFEKKLQKQGLSRFSFDRQTLYQKIWDYVQENSQTAMEQCRKLGFSLDWSRFTFTLDPKVVTTVIETFTELYAQKLVYRDLKLINYCPKCGTGFSDLEVTHVEKTTPFYHLQYGPFVIGTVRPETKFRDTALAVHPDDPRYKDHIGQTVIVQGALGPIQLTIIADEGVDPEFGTGIMKVTPAHDHHDFELGQHYHLPVTPIITFQGRMDMSWFLDQGGNPLATPEENQKYLERATKYHGKKTAEARKLIVEDLKTDGLVIKEDLSYTHSAAVCYRCGTVLEPLPLAQFFVKVKPLVAEVQKALAAGQVEIIGAGHDKILQHWLTTLRDWNISRQIVWGIRMPIWYDTRQNPDLHVTFLDSAAQKQTGQLQEFLNQGVDLTTIQTGLQELRAPIGAPFTVSQNSPGKDFIQETDTFDTWFSSGQWPFATLMNTRPGDFERFYPTSVMETGYDILPFWVMRMLLLGLFKTHQVPFKQVYLHGLVRDQKGQKMSKSRGNVVNPLEVVDQFGADALRMALVIRSSPGLDKSVGPADFKAMRNFTNKIWNAARFVASLSEESDKATSQEGVADAAVLARLDEVVQETTTHLQDLKIGLAADTLYQTFWHWYCDEVIEQAKTGQVSPEVLQQGLRTFLLLLHPFTPFVTEAVWQELQPRFFADQPALLARANWPKTS